MLAKYIGCAIVLLAILWLLLALTITSMSGTPKTSVLLASPSRVSPTSFTILVEGQFVRSCCFIGGESVVIAANFDGSVDLFSLKNNDRMRHVSLVGEDVQSNIVQIHSYYIGILCKCLSY